MTKREMLSLLIKLMGIYALVHFVPLVVQSLGILAMQSQQVQNQTLHHVLALIAIGFATPGIWIALCLVVIVKSDWFAKQIYKEDGPASQLTTLGFRDLQVLGIHLIGLLLLVGVLPQITNILTHHLYLMRDADHYNFARTHHIPNFASTAVKLVIGLYLFLYPHGLANLWALVQGKFKPQAEEQNPQP